MVILQTLVNHARTAVNTINKTKKERSLVNINSFDTFNVSKYSTYCLNQSNQITEKSDIKGLICSQYFNLL